MDNFDLAMNYIDNHILENVEEIRKGICRLINCKIEAFSNCFSVLTGRTLCNYITERKLFFAAQDLQKNPNLSISDLEFENYGFSEQSSFSRRFKEFCGATPNDVKKGIAYFSDRKYTLTKLCNKRGQITRELNKTGDLSMSNLNYIEALEKASQESGFDIDTCGEIFNLSEKLEIPFGYLLRQCENIVLDCQSNPDYLSPRIEKAMELEISSDVELREICDYYNCKYYDLDEFMVKEYRGQLESK